MVKQQELLDALINLQKQIHAHYKMNVKKDYSLMVADSIASTVIHNALAASQPEPLPGDQGNNFTSAAHNAIPALLDSIELAKSIAAQDPITYDDSASIQYRQLAALINGYQADARKILEELQ